MADRCSVASFVVVERMDYDPSVAVPVQSVQRPCAHTYYTIISKMEPVERGRKSLTLKHQRCRTYPFRHPCSQTSRQGVVHSLPVLSSS